MNIQYCPGCSYMLPEEGCFEEDGDIFHNQYCYVQFREHGHYLTRELMESIKGTWYVEGLLRTRQNGRSRSTTKRGPTRLDLLPG